MNMSNGNVENINDKILQKWEGGKDTLVQVLREINLHTIPDATLRNYGS